MLNITSDSLNQNRAAQDSEQSGASGTGTQSPGLNSEYTINPYCDNISTNVIQFLHNHTREDEPSDIYEQVIQEVEKSLFVRVMRYVSGNQTRAAKIMGLNRGTLRKKLRKYGID